MKIREMQIVRFKQPILVCAAAFLAVASLRATPVDPCAGAGASFADLSDNLTPGFSCQLGDQVYSGFFYASTALNGSSSVPANEVQIASESSTTAANGFMFSLPLLAVGSGTQDISLGYTVTDVGAGLIGNVDATCVACGVGDDGGFAQINESVYGPSGAFLGPLQVTPTSGPVSLNFAGVTSVTIAKDLIVSGNNTGSGTISLFSDYVDQTGVPEPGFYGVLAGGLGAVVMFTRRRKKTA